MTCPYFERKLGGVHYAIKCAAYHKGLFSVYSNGKSLQYFYGRGEDGAEYNKVGRDQYVAEKCKGDYESCNMYQAEQRRVLT